LAYRRAYIHVQILFPVSYLNRAMAGYFFGEEEMWRTKVLLCYTILGGFREKEFKVNSLKIVLSSNRELAELYQHCVQKRTNETRECVNCLGRARARRTRRSHSHRRPWRSIVTILN